MGKYDDIFKDLPAKVSQKPEYAASSNAKKKDEEKADTVNLNDSKYKSYNDKYSGTTYKQKTDAYGKMTGDWLTGANPDPDFTEMEYLNAASAEEAPRAVQEYKKASVKDKPLVKEIAQDVAKKERITQQHAEIRANIGKSENETYNANETNLKRSNDMLVIFLSLVIVVATAVLIKNIAMLKSESKKSAGGKNKPSRSAPSFNKKAFLLKLKKFAVVGAIIIVLIIVFIFLNYIIYLSFKFWFGDKGPMKFALAVTDSFLLLLVGLIWGLISKVAGKIIDTYRLKNRFKDLGNEILNHNGEYSLLNITAYVAGNDVPNLRNKYLQSDKPAPELLGELQLAYFKQLDLKDVEAVYRTAGELRLSYYAADLIAETYDGEIDPCIAQITWANAFYKYDDLQESAPKE